MKIGKMVRDWLYPVDRRCLACLHSYDPDESPDGVLCKNCSEALSELAEEEDACDDGHPAGLQGLHCAFPYRDQAKLLVWQLKFNSNRRAALPLIEAMAKLPVGNADLILPIPTTRRRRWKRGFNQAELIAGPLAKKHHIEYRAGILRRIDDAASQTKVKGEERKTNVINSMRASSYACGRKILLIDDVYTTGATAEEAVRALNAAGCGSVAMLAVCRAGRRSDDDDLPF